MAHCLSFVSAAALILGKGAVVVATADMITFTKTNVTAWTPDSVLSSVRLGDVAVINLI